MEMLMVAKRDEKGKREQSEEEEEETRPTPHWGRIFSQVQLPTSGLTGFKKVFISFWLQHSSIYQK